MDLKVGDVLKHRYFIITPLYALIMDITDGRYCILVNYDCAIYDEYTLEWYYTHD